MARGNRASSGGPHAGWSTPAARIAWLVQTRFGGNRSAFAVAVGVSHTIIGRVCGGQPPGRRLMTAIAGRLSVAPDWLLTGAGVPFRSEEGLSTAGLPLTVRPLPGRPSEYAGWITDMAAWPPSLAAFEPDCFYWLELSAGDSLTHSRKQGFLRGDRLLMICDPAKFPRMSHMLNRLCAVRVDGPTEVQLASVSYVPATREDGPARLEAAFFAPPTSEGREEVYRHMPGGEVLHYTRRIPVTTFRGRPRVAPVDPVCEPDLPTVRHADIVGVWTEILHRPRGVL